MDEQELKELMRLLENAGVRANLCDTPIPVSTNSARCGEPSEIGDERIDDYILIPKAVAYRGDGSSDISKESSP